MKKKIASLLLALVMILTCTAPTFASSKTVWANGNVENRLDQVRQMFPEGSFFTANGKSCSHYLYSTCSNCQLSNIMVANGYSGLNGIYNSWTCVSFARFTFWFVFGIADTASSGSAPNGATIIDISQAKVGDMVVLRKNGRNYHYGIYIDHYTSGGKTYVTLLDANGQKDNTVSKVLHNNDFEYFSTSYVVRANNYDEIANLPDVNATVETFGPEIELEDFVFEDSVPDSDPSYENFIYRKEYADDFSDIDKNMWYFEYVKTAFELGLMNGKETGEFDVYGNSTYAETISLASRLHKIYNTGNDNFNFTGENWYDTYVNYAISNNIIENIPDNMTEFVTRADFVEILVNSISDLEEIYNITSVSDVNDDDYYANAMYTFYNSGILKLSEENLFNPQSNIARAEVSAILCRLAIKSNR